GSNDPHALRRQAVGVVRLVLALDEKNISFKNLMDDLVEVSAFPESRMDHLADYMHALNDFIFARLEQIMKTDNNLSYDIRQAVLAAKSDNLTQMVEAGELLEQHKGKEDYKELVESITRILNITKANKTSGQI